VTASLLLLSEASMKGAAPVANEPGCAEVSQKPFPLEAPLPVGPVNVAPTPRARRYHPEQAQVLGHCSSGEAMLMEMLASMDQHMHHVRKTQQGLVATVELACRQALSSSFGRLVLVGSAALRVETPGSDVDIVCFTRRDGPEAPILPVTVLRKVHKGLKELIKRYSDYSSSFSMELIDDARVPILRVLWGPPEHSIAVDVSVDQTRPVDHVRWFQRVGAAPRSSVAPPVVAPLVSLILRCVKWWLKQRQIPRTKEGGLPTLAWLLMAVHVCSQPETHKQAIFDSHRPMVALLASLEAFFRYYNSLENIDGVLQFAADGSSATFKRWTPVEKKRAAPWAELAVLDPTREGAESLNLAPWLPAATQLMIVYELRRAWRLFKIASAGEEKLGESWALLEKVFEPLPAGTSELPASITGVGPVGALMLVGEIEGGSTLPEVELAIIEDVLAKPGWAAPFLMRHDERSEVHVTLCAAEESGGQYYLRKKSSVVLCPVHFISRVRVEKDSKGKWKLDSNDYQRFTEIKKYVAELGVPRNDGVPDVNRPYSE